MCTRAAWVGVPLRVYSPPLYPGGLAHRVLSRRGNEECVNTTPRSRSQRVSQAKRGAALCAMSPSSHAVPSALTCRAHPESHVLLCPGPRSPPRAIKPSSPHPPLSATRGPTSSKQACVPLIISQCGRAALLPLPLSSSETLSIPPAFTRDERPRPPRRATSLRAAAARGAAPAPPQRRRRSCCRGAGAAAARAHQRAQPVPLLRCRGTGARQCYTQCEPARCGLGAARTITSAVVATGGLRNPRQGNAVCVHSSGRVHSLSIARVAPYELAAWATPHEGAALIKRCASGGR